MAIRHEEQYDGGFHSVAHVVEGRKVRSIGMLEPGEYDLGIAEARQTILVSTGVIEVNYYPVSAGEERTIDAGENIEFRVETLATYVCFYYNEQ